MSDKYDYLVIGSGPAGHVSAIKAAQLGLKVAVVEKDPGMFGGVCLNEGCIPAKALYRCASIYDSIRRSKELCGIEAEYGAPNLSAFVKRSRQKTEQLKKGLKFLFKKNGIDLLEGAACFQDSQTVHIRKEQGGPLTIKADKYLIATGSVPRVLPGLGFDGERIISSSEAIRLGKVPERLLIIGGGYIGMEFASYFNILGSEVTIVEMKDSVLPEEDEDIGRRMQAICRQKGIKVLSSSTVSGAEISDGHLAVTIDGRDLKIRENYDIILVSAGRRPVTENIGLDKAEINTDKDGFIIVDFEMRTSNKNVYAAGDVVPGPMLAHAGYTEGEKAALSAAGDEVEALDYGCVPSVAYTDIQTARVGLTEREVKEKNIDYSEGKYFFKANGKAVINSQTEGFIKILADNSTHKILGVHIIGEDAADLIHEFVVAKKAGVSVDELAEAVHAHPTLSEAVPEACRSVFGRAIHG
ncbi:MAG: dihydrolipoyl dehydrogenase [Candidatus Omnitrophica bacterium]|nr:dihydrolipoyl dehydrogenase [Candidatus Omnitrophota bacterium]